MTNQVTVEFLDAFAAAWNRHDVDALMTFMTEDCVFEASRAGSSGLAPLRRPPRILILRIDRLAP